MTAVLAHLRRHRPRWDWDRYDFYLWTLCGKETVGRFPNVTIVNDAGLAAWRDHILELDWHESDGDNPPCTKAARCLREVFGIEPDLELMRYKMWNTTDEIDVVCAYLISIGCQFDEPGGNRCNAVLIHYQGNTSADKKDLPHDVVRDVCDVVIKAGCVPVILDWDKRSPLVDNVKIFCPGADHELWGGRGTGDAALIAALIQQARLMIGVDSGPLHCAGATTTPTIAVWTKHHPVHFFDLADNVTHLVPGDHPKFAAGPKSLAFFAERYKSQVYKSLAVDLPALVESRLTGENFDVLAQKRFGSHLHAKGFGSAYYFEHREAGLDYLGFGDWQRQYGRWLAACFGWKGKRVLDVGCACGAILRGFGEAGVVVQGVDVNEYAVNLGREKWPDMAELLHVCDAVNLHLFEDERWDGLHSAQVAEHWKPELVPFILKELHRVTKPGGLFFCCLDTEELFARQGRDIDTEDPTHVCIASLAWWLDIFEMAGWCICTQEYRAKMIEHQDNFLDRYDWDFIVARRE